jgi:SWI/SNF-related matrix-associated actin-dependent regulator 1 of chromatin subfamily A
MSTKEIYLGDTEIILSSPFIREEVKALKASVGSARWDRIAEVWRIPVIDRDAAVVYAETWNYAVTDELRHLELPKNLRQRSDLKVEAKHVTVSFPFDPIMVNAVNDLPGSRWHANSRTWRLPLAALGDAVAFAEEYKLQVSPDVLETVERIAQSASRSVAASRATDAALRVPGLALELYPFQRAGVAYIMDKRRAFLADEMGLGKTLQALASVELAGDYPCIVVCPPKLPLDWEMKIHEALPHRSVHRIQGRGDFPEITADFTVIGYSNTHHHKDGLVDHKYKSAIFDESQAYMNNKSQRTVAAKKIGKSVPIGNIVLELTGTPIASAASEFGPQLDIIGRASQFGGQWAFYKKFCGAFQDSYGQWHKDGNAPKGRLSELNDILRQTCYVRRLKVDVIDDLPDIIRDKVYVEMSEKWRTEYDEAEADIVEYFADLKEKIAIELGENATVARIRAKIAARAGEHLVRISVLKRITANAKLEMAHDWIEARTIEGNKVIVAAHHREITTALANKHGGLKIVGGQKVESVEEDKEAFQKLSCAEAPVITLSVQAAKTGHTLTASKHVLIVEQPWTPTDEDQIIARAHRIGQKFDVQVTNLLIPDTIDITTFALVEAKRVIVTEATDGTVDTTKETQSMAMSVIDGFLNLTD